MDPTKYPGPEALDSPGSKDGEMKVVNMPDGAHVFTCFNARLLCFHGGRGRGNKTIFNTVVLIDFFFRQQAIQNYWSCMKFKFVLKRTYFRRGVEDGTSRGSN